MEQFVKHYPGGYEELPSENTPVTAGVLDDIEQCLFDASGEIITNETQIISGFISANETWTFSSFSTTTRKGVITVPSDATTKYSIGNWVKITQSTGGTKYGMITAVSSTTITVNFFATYTLNSEAISSPYYSRAFQPFGAPKLPVKSTDAAGWTVWDYGTYHEWTKKGTVSASIPAMGWGQYGTIALPSALSSIGTNILSSGVIANDNACRVSAGGGSDYTTIAISAYNTYGSTINPTIYYQFRILET